MLLTKKKLFLVVNVDWFFLSHRLPIALEAKKRGYKVTIFSIDTGKGKEIESYGLRFIPLPTTRSGTSIFKEIKVILLLAKYYWKEKPDIVHHVAVKPVTYGSLVAKLLRVPKVVNALSGMGFLFINAENNQLKHKLVNSIFKFSFKNKRLTFILQNKDDVEWLTNMNILSPNQIKLIKGSGVDLLEYKYCSEPETNKIRVILMARMLWDKGVEEFVKAAEILKPKFAETAEFILCGTVDEGNNACISEKQLKDWTAEGNVNWIGFNNDMVSILANSHIVVLPSYREGLPKSLIEASATGRPMVSTNVPGCREVVVDGINGFLVEVKNPKKLAEAIEKLILQKDLRNKMGKAARKIAEQEFSINSVIDKTFDIYESKLVN